MSINYYYYFLLKTLQWQLT